MSRAEVRVRHLETAWRKLAERVGTHPKDRRAKRWKARLAEYERSLINLRDHGVETVPGGDRKGVEISVPVGKYSVEEAG